MIDLVVYLPEPERSVHIPPEIVGVDSSNSIGPVATPSTLSVYIPPEIVTTPQELIEEFEIPLLPASKIGSGILDLDRIPAIPVEKIDWGTEEDSVFDSHQAEADSLIEAGQPLYLKPNGHADLASAMTIETARAIGLALVAASPTTSVQYSPDRTIELDDWTTITDTATLTPGATYFLSPTPGKLTMIAPTETGQVVIVVGNALSVKTLAIEIQSPILL